MRRLFALVIVFAASASLDAQTPLRWGGDADYEAYKTATPVLVPMIVRPKAVKAAAR